MTSLRLERYLMKSSRLVRLFVEQTSTANVVRLDVCDGNDHAGVVQHAIHKTDMTLIRNAHCFKESSHTQSSISHKTVESECYGRFICATVGGSVKKFMLADLGTCVDLIVPTDSSSRSTVDSRGGPGRLRRVVRREGHDKSVSDVSSNFWTSDV